MLAKKARMAFDASPPPNMQHERAALRRYPDVVIPYVRRFGISAAQGFGLVGVLIHAGTKRAVVKKVSVRFLFGQRPISSYFVLATRSTVLNVSRCCGPTEVMMPIVGRTRRHISLMSPHGARPSPPQKPDRKALAFHGWHALRPLACYSLRE